jgi:glycosyltransferase involved in cell wall biosynthesis
MKSCNKKILIVCNSEFVYNKFIKETKIFLNKKSILVEILSGQKINKKNFHFVKFPFGSFFSYFRFISASIKIFQLLKKNNYTAVIHNNRNASICSRLSLLFISTNIKSIYFSRGMYFHDNQNPISYFLSFAIEIFFLLKTDLILSQNKEDLDKISFFSKLFSVKAEYVGNGVDIKKFKKFKKNFNFKSKVNICTICRFSQGKGLELLMETFLKIIKTNPNCFLTIIGGPRNSEDIKYYNEFLKNYNVKNYSKNIFITGLKSDVNKHLRLNQIYVHPSFREGMPRSLIEAMSSGLICISNNVRGSRELILNNKNGFIYNSSDELYLLLDKIIKMKISKTKKISNNASFFIKKNFNQNKYLDLQYKYVSKLLQ